jgi:hypothetical protein
MGLLDPPIRADRIIDSGTAGRSVVQSETQTAVRTAIDVGQAFTTTTVKTSAYTAAVADLIPADATAIGFTITLPAAPPDKSRVVAKKIDATTNIVTIAAAGADVFNKSGGSTTLLLSLKNETAVLQYKSSGAIWYGASTELTDLDAHFDARTASSIATAVAAATTVVAAAETAVSTAINGRTLSEARPTNTPDYEIAVGDQDGRPTWIQADTSGNPTPNAVAALRTAGVMVPETGTTAEIAIADAAGNPTWLQAASDGGPTPVARNAMRQKIGFYRGTTQPTPDPGSGEYLWFKMDGNGTLLDILAGKA